MTAVDDYLSRIPEPERAALERLRVIIHEAAPDAQEAISYGMPGFKYKGKYLAGFNAHTHHLALYPTGAPVEAYKDQLTACSLSRGTIRFTLDNPLPSHLVKDLIRYRMAAIDAA